MNILVLGARGNIGLHIATLLAGLPEINLHLSSHSDAGVAEIATRFPSARAVKVDFADASSVAAAVNGMQRIAVISPDFTDEAVATGNLIDCLKRSDSLESVIRVLGLWPSITERDVPTWMRDVNATCWQHLTARRLLTESNLPVTFINPASRYMQNFWSFQGKCIRDQHVLAYPFPITLPHIDTRDISEVIARLLKADAAAHIGKEYVITGAREDVLSFVQIAELLSEVLGFKVEYLDDTQYIYTLMDQKFATLFVNYLRWQQKAVGDVFEVNDEVERFLGRPPRKLRDWIAEHAHLYRNRLS